MPLCIKTCLTTPGQQLRQGLGSLQATSWIPPVCPTSAAHQRYVGLLPSARSPVQAEPREIFFGYIYLQRCGSKPLSESRDSAAWHFLPASQTKASVPACTGAKCAAVAAQLSSHVSANLQPVAARMQGLLHTTSTEESIRRGAVAPVLATFPATANTPTVRAGCYRLPVCLFPRAACHQEMWDGCSRNKRTGVEVAVLDRKEDLPSQAVFDAEPSSERCHRTNSAVPDGDCTDCRLDVVERGGTVAGKYHCWNRNPSARYPKVGNKGARPVCRAMRKIRKRLRTGR